jgi:hypothetical protein
MSIRMTATIATVLVVASTACVPRPLLEGGFAGSYECGNGDLGATAVFDEEKDGDVNGAMFAEVELLLLGKQYTRFELDNGQHDLDKKEYEFTLVAADNTDRFTVEAELDEDTGNRLTGKVTEVRTDNETPAECDLDMDRVAVSANN